MRSKILAVLVVVVAMMGVSPAAMAKVGGGGGGGGKGGWSHSGMHGHGHFDHRFARRDFFNRRLFNSFGWGWGGDWGWGGYGDSGYGGNNTVVVFPQAIPRAATGSVDPGPCKWNQQEFKVPSSAGGTRPVQVVSCH
jgi:hypothetical protein